MGLRALPCIIAPNARRALRCPRRGETLRAMCDLYSITRGSRRSATSPAPCATSRATCRCCPASFPIIPLRSSAPRWTACANSRWRAGVCRRRPSPSPASHLPASHRRGLERGVDLGSRPFRCCVSYMLARLRQRLTQPRDRSICRPQIVEVAIPHQFRLAERSCASEDGLTSALLHIRHLPLQFGDAPVRIDERPVAQLSVAHQNQILRRLSAPSSSVPRDRSPRSPIW